ncbi:MAG: YitT family protein [Treponema sp.]|nr:YitT family protein [Treponema sp.]
MVKKHPVVTTVRQLTLIILAAVLMAFNLNTFIKAGELIPGGFTGVTVLIQAIGLRYLDINIPFSLVLYMLNAVPAVICFRFVGKKFTLYSLLMVFLCGLMTDFMPNMFINFIQLHDTLLSAVFGGIFTGFAIILCLLADATSGGTDFIAIFISEKFRKDAWNYIFMGNCVILGITAFLFDLDKALYSIILQFTTTTVLNSLNNTYKQKTLLIITNCPVEVYNLIRGMTNHAATVMNAKGLYDMQDRSILYSVVYSDEVTPLINEIRTIDPAAFINVLKTDQINGKFFKKPRE